MKNRVRAVGVSDDYLLYDSSPAARLGVYYYETGAAPRKPTIVYDRKGASVTRISLDEIPPEVYASARMFHTSGISLALCPNTRAVATELIRRFKNGGAQISFDVNYRANLWGEAEARAAIEEILPLVDVLFVSEETSRRMFQKKMCIRDRCAPTPCTAARGPGWWTPSRCPAPRPRTNWCTFCGEAAGLCRRRGAGLMADECAPWFYVYFYEGVSTFSALRK